MKRLLLLISIIFLTGISSFANHIKGGFFSYQYLGTNPSDPTKLLYSIKLTVYMLCTPNNDQLSSPINFSIFNGQTNQFIRNESVLITAQYTLNKSYDDPCITGNQAGCYYYIVEYNLSSVELPINNGGYTIAYQRCCRIDGIVNLTSPSNSIGNTFSITIPGNAILQGANVNSSPRFLVNDTAVVCGGSFFQYSFSASDENNDSLSYEFCEALEGANQTVPAPATASNPPYNPVDYSFPYGGSAPLGTAVTINSKTGLISGIAPAASGEYVIGVCVNEYRNGIWIGSTRKELHVRIGDCNAVKATLILPNAFCDGFTVNFSNATNSPLINSYFWDFGVIPLTNDTSNLASPTFIFPDTGVYTIKLAVNRNQSCADSTTSIARVFPGFFPAFNSSGICINKPTSFFDQTTTVYGVVSGWRWDFGESSVFNDTSRLKDPVYTYPAIGTKSVQFIVNSSKGCIDTVNQPITIIDKPPINLPFRDTLICSIDTLSIPASGSGIFSWGPNYNILFAGTPAPSVYPKITTWYKVDLDENGCKNTDSVRVRVVDNVSLSVRSDTVFCKGDGVQLNAVTDALKFSWAPNINLSNPTIVNPIANPSATTTYLLTASIGKCNTTDDVKVIVVPYPFVNAGPDLITCYKTPVQLNASITGISFSWRPQGSLNNPNILNPIASPSVTTKYILSAIDTLGCPKPGYDTVLVTVLPKVKAFAGNDTAIVAGQPLQLNATGGANYSWSPPFGLNNTRIANPIARLFGNPDSIRYKVFVTDQFNCLDSATILVKIFKTNPQIFVPTGFTPNADGKNDVLKPIAVGIEKIEYFRVYNRWGQLVFSTIINGQGWDGRIGGKDQTTGVYVWLVKAVDYTGKTVFQKGTATLIR